MSHSPPDSDILKISFLILHTLDNLQGWGGIQKDLLRLKSACLVLQDWDNWFRQGCDNRPPKKEISKMIDELNFLLRECREGLENNLNEIESDLEKAHDLARPLACECRAENGRK